MVSKDVQRNLAQLLVLILKIKLKENKLYGSMINKMKINKYNNNLNNLNSFNNKFNNLSNNNKQNIP